MIQNFTELSKEMFFATQHNSWDDNRINYLCKLLKVYEKAGTHSKSLGYVGVGCITYAEQSMQDWQIKNPYETWEPK